MSSFKSVEVLSQDCHQYAIDAVNAENEVYGPNTFWGNLFALDFYYDLCEEANEEGGEALEPVFIN